MKGFSSILLFLAGFAAAPYLVGLTEHFIKGAPDWFPYLVILLVAGVFYAVGVGELRLAAAGMVIGVVLFGLGQQYIPQRIDFLRVEAPKPF